MSQLDQAVTHMHQQEGLTNLFSWEYPAGKWHATVQIEHRTMYSGHGASPIEALLAALGAAYAGSPKRAS